MLTMIGCSAPYVEAIEARLADHNLVRPISRVADELIFVQCDSDENWECLALEAARDTVCIAVLPGLVMDDYTRALAAGAAGVVQLDTPSAIVVEVVDAAVNGETVLPRQVAQNMALLAQRRKAPRDMKATEVALLQEIATGITIVELARRAHYSERTVRRQLQSLYVKLGARNRAEAISAATGMGLVG